jgi:hypothetical protein
MEVLAFLVHLPFWFGVLVGFFGAPTISKIVAKFKKPK